MPQPMIRTLATEIISREAASALTAAALEAAASAGTGMSVAVVDAGGALISFARSDGAPPMTADVAIGKAWTAATSGFPTHTWNQIVASPEVAPLIQLPRMMAISGGYPLHENGRVIGAIGISGGNAEMDLKVAKAALEVTGFAMQS